MLSKTFSFCGGSFFVFWRVHDWREPEVTDFGTLKMHLRADIKIRAKSELRAFGWTLAVSLGKLNSGTQLNCSSRNAVWGCGGGLLWSSSETFQFQSPCPSAYPDAGRAYCRKYQRLRQNHHLRRVFSLTGSRKSRKRYFLKYHVSHCWCLESRDKPWACSHIFGCSSKHALNGVWNKAYQSGIGQGSRLAGLATRQFCILFPGPWRWNGSFPILEPYLGDNSRNIGPNCYFRFAVNIILKVVESYWASGPQNNLYSLNIYAYMYYWNKDARPLRRDCLAGIWLVNFGFGMLNRDTLWHWGLR